MEAAKTKHLYCGHCEQEVSRSTLYAHKRLYCNRMTREWLKARISYVGSDHQTPGPHEESPESDADDLDTAQYSPLHFENQDGGVRL